MKIAKTNLDKQKNLNYNDINDNRAKRNLMYQNPDKQITLKDIALATGYSVNTVSRALRGKDDIAKETSEKIKQVASEMGYVNNMIAASLRLGYKNLRLGFANSQAVPMGEKTNTFAVILGDILNPFFSSMLKELEQHSRFLGYSSFFSNTNENNAIEREAINIALNKNVDGIIICPAQHQDDNILHLKESGVPFVLVGRRQPGIITDYVMCDDALCGYLATQYLLVRGHTRILLINGPDHISSARDRLAGYCRAYQETGLAVDETLIRSFDLVATHCAVIADELLQGSINCTAIFTFNDMVAWRLWAELSNRGLKVPDHYSLVGCDNLQSRVPAPYRLTSVDTFVEKMAVLAVDALVSKLRSGNREPLQTLLKPQLFLGNTVAAPRKGSAPYL